jgi:hypothetical protein
MAELTTFDLATILLAGADAAEFPTICTACGADAGSECAPPGSGPHPARPTGDTTLTRALRAMARQSYELYQLTG